MCPHCCIFLHRQTPQRHSNTFKRGISFLRVVHSPFFRHSSFNFHFLCVFFVGFWQTHAHTHKGNAYVWHSSVVVVCATRYVRPELLSRRVTRIFIILIWIYLGWQIYNRLFLHFCSFCPQLIFCYCCSLIHFVIHPLCILFGSLLDYYRWHFSRTFLGIPRNEKRSCVFMRIWEFQRKLPNENLLTCLDGFASFPVVTSNLHSHFLVLALSHYILSVSLLVKRFLIPILLGCCVVYLFSLHSRETSLYCFLPSRYYFISSRKTFHSPAFTYSLLRLSLFILHINPFLYSHICSRIIFINS